MVQKGGNPRSLCGLPVEVEKPSVSKALHNDSCRHSGLDPESGKFLIMLDPGACPGLRSWIRRGGKKESRYVNNSYHLFGHYFLPRHSFHTPRIQD
jgi:hypothetical protein